MAKTSSLKNLLKKSKKPLDKLKRVWYNKRGKQANRQDKKNLKNLKKVLTNTPKYVIL